MKLNPFIKFRIGCALSVEQARNRLAMFTLQQPLISPWWRFSPLPRPRKTDRLVGKISDDRFTVTPRPRSMLARALDLQYQNMVIKGRFAPAEPGCTITVKIRPTLNTVLAWLILPLVTVFLLADIIPGISYSHAGAGAAFCALLFYVITRQYRKNVEAESGFLVTLFEEQTSGIVIPIIRSNPSPVGR